VVNNRYPKAYGAGAEICHLDNCILYLNTVNTSLAQYEQNYYSSTLTHCCTTPQPNGFGNITNAPLFVDQSAPSIQLALHQCSTNSQLNQLMKTNLKNLLFLPTLTAVVSLIPAGRVSAQTFTTLHSFTRVEVIDNGNFTFSFTNYDGAFPSAVLVTNSAGTTLYGTAAGGGGAGRGTVFAVGTDGTGFKSLHSFTNYGRNGTNSDGANPSAGLIVAGNTLYGTASAGGSSGKGTLFSLSFRP